jgi:DNA-binding MarR family transcriptional regulator
MPANEDTAIDDERRRVESSLRLGAIDVGRSLWRDLLMSLAADLSKLDMSLVELATLYAADRRETLTVGEIGELIGRSPSATSRIISALERRGWVRRREEVADRRQRTLEVTAEGKSLLARVDGARAEEFLSIVRPLPSAERALVAMGVAALSTHALTRRGRLIKERG